MAVMLASTTGTAFARIDSAPGVGGHDVRLAQVASAGLMFESRSRPSGSEVQITCTSPKTSSPTKGKVRPGQKSAAVSHSA